MSDKGSPGPRGPNPRNYILLMLVWAALGAFVLYEVATLGPTPMRWLLLAIAGGGIALNLIRMRK